MEYIVRDKINELLDDIQKFSSDIKKETLSDNIIYYNNLLKRCKEYYPLYKEKYGKTYPSQELLEYSLNQVGQPLNNIEGEVSSEQLKAIINKINPSLSQLRVLLRDVQVFL